MVRVVLLGLIEVLIRLTTDSPIVKYILLFTLLIYSLVGVTSGSIFAVISILFQRVFRGRKEPDTRIPFSMAACISIITFLYALIFFIKVLLNSVSSMVILKTVVLFSLSIAMLFVLPAFFRWMDRKGKLFFSYISLLPSLWIITTLRLNRNKNILLTFSR